MVGSAISTNSRSRLFLWSSDAAGLNGPGCPTEGEVIEVVGVAPQRVAVAAAVSRLNVGIPLIGSVARFVVEPEWVNNRMVDIHVAIWGRAGVPAAGAVPKFVCAGSSVSRKA